jgi:diacylglycerol kinase (ATP)
MEYFFKVTYLAFGSSIILRKEIFFVVSAESINMKALFIVNPSAGNSSNDKILERVPELASETGFEYKILETTGNNDDQIIQDTLSQYKPDRVIAGGGDGTIQLVARNLMHRKIPLGILPLGSANGFATALGLPKNSPEAVDLMVKAERTLPLDMLKFNDKHLCIHLGDIGINALMVKNFEESGEKGMMGYAKFLFSSIQQTPLLHYIIKTPEETFQKEGYMLAFANAHKYGTGIHISEGSVSDGKFEICNVERVALDSAIKAGLTILNVFVDKDMFSDVISCAHAEIFIDQPTDLQIDGEYMGKVDYLKVDIISSAIPLLIP